MALLRERIASIPGEVERALALEAPPVVRDLARCPRWITTGVGASEGAARLLAFLLRSLGILAEFVPISSFVTESPPQADVCVVVTQGLSPNARLALARRGVYPHTVLVTTRNARTSADVAAAAASGTVVITHGPQEEDGLLLRVVGPACASATVLALALEMARALGAEPGWSKAAREVPGRMASAAERVRDAVPDGRSLADVVALVAAGDDVALCDPLRHKLLEGLGIGHPPLWDVCGVAHGPLQSFYDRRATLLSLERGTSGARAALVQRLGRVLDPERHALVRLVSTLPGPLALFDFDAQLDHLLLRALEAAPRDLANWPGKGRDAPLYGLGADD